jgi:cell division protein FtsQ
MLRSAALAFVRAPSLPLPTRRPPARALVVAAAVAAIVALGYIVSRETPLFALRDVEVRDATPEVAKDVRPILADLRGASLVALDGGELERRLRSVPSVRAASVDRAFPHTLEVRITPERPLAVVRDGPRAWLVAESGRVVRSVAVDARPHIPRIRVERTSVPRLGATLADAPTAAALAVLRALPTRFPGSVLYAAVSDGEAELVLRDGPAIRLGLPLDLERKLEAARAVLATIAEDERAAIAYLDVSVPERVVAANDPQP